MINNKKVGNAIALLRRRQKLTQKELADKLNVSDKAVSKWERGLGLPDISVLSTLSMILDTDMESLLEGNVEYKKVNWIGAINLNNFSIDISCLIYDKPIITYQIAYLMLAGIKDIYLIGNKIDRKLINRLINNISINVNYIVTVDELPQGNIMLINEPLFLYGQSITRSFQKAMERRSGITILSLSEHLNNNIEIYYDSNHRVVDSIEDAVEASYKYNALPIIFYPKEYKAHIRETKLNIIVENLIKNKELYTEPMFRGIIYIPLIMKSDINDASKIVEIVQKRDYKICDLKEIEQRRGLK